MIEGGGLGEVDPDEVGPIDDAGRPTAWSTSSSPTRRRRPRRRSACSATSRARPRPGAAPDQAPLRDAGARARAPRLRRRSRSSRRSPTRARSTFLRERFAPEMVTALARIEGRPLGLIANDTRHMAGAITSDAADKAARFLQLCDALRPAGRLAGRHAGDDGRPRGRGDRPGPPRLAPAGRRRRAEGAAGRAWSCAAATASAPRRWSAAACTSRCSPSPGPPAHLGPMGLEGAVRLALRKELEAIADEAEREQRVRDLTAAAEENAKALNAAALFELDDVIDPAETRSLIASTLAAAAPGHPAGGSGRFIDAW